MKIKRWSYWRGCVIFVTDDDETAEYYRRIGREWMKKLGREARRWQS